MAVVVVEAAVAVVPCRFGAGVECLCLGAVHWAAAVLQTGWAVAAAFLVADRAARVGAVLILTVPAIGTAATGMAIIGTAEIGMAIIGTAATGIMGITGIIITAMM